MSSANHRAYSKLKNVLAQSTAAVNPVEWLYSALTDLPMPAGQFRTLAQRLDRYADELDRSVPPERLPLPQAKVTPVQFISRRGSRAGS